MRLAFAALATDPHDLPFALLYLLDPTNSRAALAGSYGMAAGSAMARPVIDLSSSDEPWPLLESMREGRSIVLPALGPWRGAEHLGPWPESADAALVLPLSSGRSGEIAGFLVVGISARLVLDDEYRRFLEDVALRVGRSLASQRAQIELARSNADLDQFAAMASHDLQEPLRMIGSYLTLLERRMGEGLEAATRGYIAQAVDGAKRMQRLIQHLLEFARIGREPMRFESIDSLTPFAEAVQNLVAQIDERRAQVTHGDLPTVLTHRDHLLRLFQNMIANALKYGRPGVAPRVHVSARASADGKEWTFIVADNGLGIAAEDQERIFAIFERVDGSAGQPGSGLGLAICRRIIDRHGGRLWVESEVGVGSRFLFTLPAAPPAR